MNVLWHASGNVFFFFKDGKVVVLSPAEARRVRTLPPRCHLLMGSWSARMQNLFSHRACTSCNCLCSTP